jgi:hypothetical protein
MAHPRLAEEVMRDVLELVAAHNGNVSAAAAARGISRETLKGQHYKARQWQAARGEIGGPPIPEIGRPAEGFEVVANNAQYDGDGNLKSQSVRTRRAAGGEYEIPAGHTVKGESALLDADGRLMARWVKTKEGGGEGLVEALKAAFAEHDGAAGILPEPEASDDDLLTVYPVPDLHLGMRSWKDETGADYDVKIAVKTASKSVETLVSQSRPSRNAVVLILGDFFHQNDSKNVTPGSGHQLDVDGRWPAVYLAGAKLVISIVESVARKHANVELAIRPGNHDADAAVTLSVALGLYYSENPRITVNMTPGITWYRRFGNVLLGGHHGHTMKADRAAMAMAVDRSEDWGQTQHRHIFSGHLHHEVANEVGGVRIETMSSPAARDAWNAASGYRSNRALSAVTFHALHGEIGRHRVNIAGDWARVRAAA